MRSFADRLADLFDRQPGDDRHDRPFANGTMHATVSAFGARGFFADATPGHAVPEPASADIAPERRNDVSWERVAEPDTVDATIHAHVADPGDARAVITPLQRSVTGARVVSASGIRSVQSAPAPVPRPVAGSAKVAKMRVDLPPTQSAGKTRPVPGRPTARASSPIAVAMQVDGTDVVVSLTGDAAILEDEAKLHRAISRMLARHGLQLGGLRIAGRAAVATAEQGRR